MTKKAIDISNKRFGRWVAKKHVPTQKYGGRRSSWLCVCDCGAKKVVNSWHLRKGFSTSCGCFADELMLKNLKKYSFKKRTL